VRWVLDLLPLVLTAGVGGTAGLALPPLVHRVPRDEPVRARPLLARRCPTCGAPVPLRRLLPLLGAALCGLFAWRPGPGALLPAFCYLALLGVALAAIDLGHRRLPNALVLPSYAIGAALLLLAALVRQEPGAFARALLGMAAMFGFYLVLALLHQGGLGFGDVKLAGVLGLYLGYLGIAELLVGAFLGFLLGGLAGAGLLLTRRATRQSHIPFGPFMVAGTVVAVLWAPALTRAYLGGAG
jgi:leader peptidase (prepilin peptidase) / N-methyltransferase